MKESQKKLSVLAGIGAFLAAIVTSPNAAGQEMRESGAQFEIEEIIVTAQRREQKLQDVPISIAVISEPDLRAHSVNRLSGVGTLTPNVTFTEDEQSGNSAGLIYIRGVGQSDAFITNDAGVGVYVDGVYIGRMKGLNLDLIDIDRIEMLRGPQGTLFGRNSVGGALNIVSAKPGRDFGGSAEVDIGRFDRIDAKASVNLPLVEDKLAAKISLLTANRDGYGTRYDFFSGKKIDEMGDVESLAGRAAINWTPRDNVDVLLSIDGSRIREAGSIRKVPFFQQTFVTDLYAAFVPGDPPYGDQAFRTDDEFTSFATGGNAYEVDSYGVAGTIEWSLNNLSIKSITAYRDLDTLAGLDPDGTPYTVVNQYEDVNQNQWSQELQFTGTSFGERLQWVTGLFFFSEEAHARERVDVFVELREAIGLDVSSLHLTDNTTTSYAAYGQGTFNITDKLRLTGGLRYTYEEKDTEREILNPFTGSVSAAIGSTSDNWDSLSPKVSLEYHFNDDVMTYMSATQGFKSGGINGRSFSSLEFLPYDPEVIWTYEVGLRSEWFQRRLLFNTTLFYSDYTDMQFTVLTGDPETGEGITIVDNAAEAEIKGFEIDLAVLPTSRLTVNAGVGFTDAEYTKVDPEVLIISENSKFVKTPEWSFNLFAKYDVPISDIGMLTANVGYSYKGKVYHDHQNSEVVAQSGYGLVDARLTYEHGNNWEMSVYGTNLTDERYILAGADFLSILGWAEQHYARPREWGINLRYKF